MDRQMEAIKQEVQDLKPLDAPNALALQSLRKKHPSIPVHALPKPKSFDQFFDDFNEKFVDEK